MSSLPTIIFVLLIIIMILAITPPSLWFIMNIKKYRETYNLSFKKIVFWSWFVCYGAALVVGIIIAIIVLA